MQNSIEGVSQQFHSPCPLFSKYRLEPIVILIGKTEHAGCPGRPTVARVVGLVGAFKHLPCGNSSSDRLGGDVQICRVVAWSNCGVACHAGGRRGRIHRIVKYRDVAIAADRVLVWRSLLAVAHDRNHHEKEPDHYRHRNDRRQVAFVPGFIGIPTATASSCRCRTRARLL